MLMWNCTKKYYTGKMGDGFLSDLAYRSSNADIDPQNFETVQNW